MSTSDGSLLKISNLTSRKLYAAIIKDKRPVVSSQKKWNNTFPVPQETSNEYWEEIYKMPYKVARDTKLQASQYRIIHRILPCNKFLNNLTIQQTDFCSFCQSSDTIEHFLFYCPQTKLFWGNICNWMDKEADILLTVPIRAIIFGVPKSLPNAKVVNFLLLFIKFYIQRQKLFHLGQLSMVHLLRELRVRLRVEKYITELENRKHKFYIWHRLYNALG